MGHEVSGVVAELGEGVDAAWLGARVVTETYFSTCGQCAHCRGGRPNLCLERRSIGSFVDGGFAPRLHVPARNLHRIPDWLDASARGDDRAARLLLPVAARPGAIERGRRRARRRPGPIGLLAAQVARAAGGEVHVRGTPRDASRLEAARALGFTTSTTERRARAASSTSSSSARATRRA